MKKALKIVLAVLVATLAISLIGHSGFAKAVIRAPFASDYTI